MQTNIIQCFIRTVHPPATQICCITTQLYTVYNMTGIKVVPPLHRVTKNSQSLENGLLSLAYQKCDTNFHIPTKVHNMFPKHTVPGWNHLVRDSHQAARESVLIWQAVGSPRRGPLYDLMKIKQAQFKRSKTEESIESLKDCIKSEQS